MDLLVSISTIVEHKLIAHTGNNLSCLTEKETTKQWTEEETSEKSVDFLMTLHFYVLNYFINYTAKKNWGIFNK